MSYIVKFTLEEIEADKADILQMSKEGIPITKMKIELGRSKQYIQQIRKELISEGKITEEEIKTAFIKYQTKQLRAKKQQDRNSKASTMDDTKLKEYVSSSLEKGRTQEDIITELINDGHTSVKIRNCFEGMGYKKYKKILERLIESGKVTQDMLEKNRVSAIRISINPDTVMTPEEQTSFIIEKSKQGYTPTEIVESDKTNSLTMPMVKNQRDLLFKRGILSREEIDKAMKQRQKVKLQEKRSNVLKEIIKYTKLGYTLSEIASIIGYNLNDVGLIKKEYSEKHGWFSQKEIKQFREKRRNKEEKERLKKQKEGKKVERKLESAKKHLIKARKAAKKEEKLEIDFEEDNSNLSRKKYLEIVTQFYNDFGYIEEEDIELVKKFINSSAEIANKDIIKAIIMNSYKNGGIQETIKSINELAQYLWETEYGQYLSKYRLWLRKLELLSKVREFKNNKMSNDEIAKILGISSTEVVLLLSGKIREFVQEEFER